MSSLSRTDIEYGTHNWNWLTGCDNGPDICLTRETCWARGIAKRFHQDFIPTFHEDKFDARFPRKPGARILVCFTGDISYATKAECFIAAVRIVDHPEHTFILLTKRPAEAYSVTNQWPRNARLGASLTGAETKEKQKNLLEELRLIKGNHQLWLSYEPTLKPLGIELTGIHWIAIGCQSGKGALKPNLQWITDALAEAHKSNTKVWLKNNILKIFPNLPHRQELFP